LLCGVVFGFALAWSRVTDPAVIRDMLLLREADVFLLMGSAIAVAAIGARLLRGAGARSLVTLLAGPRCRFTRATSRAARSSGRAGASPRPVPAQSPR
jgi:hypothetical protein